MSEETSRIYGEPLDITKFFKGSFKLELLDLIITEAEKFYDEHGVSPIIHQDKFSGYLIDYFFIAKCLIKFIPGKTRNRVVGEKVALRIEEDFWHKENNDKFFENGKFLASILALCEIIISGKQSRYLYTSLLYFDENETKGIILNALILNSKLLDDMEESKGYKSILKKIGSKKKYKFYGLGGKKLQDFLIEIANRDLKLITFAK